ncbi:NAD-dependent succinate-semialdehyde dehydrogenase [Acidithrix ferrooxidans]|uniref:Succinate-semialdehyde dehydrogenase [NADP(+)] GabD n=2 Tax=root TaxID=1 RepID=A0A0D8HFZ7_9ACTN|nr:NAD-dependent succinate-semialdehyde dehydrogenase [Acidithrix ferrooxidans]KJF16819.1 succinate-semialdehyde dehydrogenase [NADP(+)] GabD [Acidithrix ferrooxidans]
MAITTRALLDAGAVVPMLIGGEWVPSFASNLREVTNPVDDRVIAQIAYGGVSEAQSAADQATAAFESWSNTSSRYRADILWRTYELILERADEIGALLSLETGKLLSEGIGETRFSAEYFRWFSEEIRRPQGEVFASEDRSRKQLSISRPIGVAATLTPWNFPLSIQARKVAPALAAGCTVVARPSEKAPLAVGELFRALVDAGLPPGVANLIYGPASIQSNALIDHDGIGVISFTGSTPVGSALMRQASNRIVRCALELGGDAPYIIFSDANIDRAIEGLAIAKFRNNGQSCIAANRVFVEDSIMDQVCERLAKLTSSMRIGDPLGHERVDLGPLIDSSRVRDVDRICRDALDSGASFLGESPIVPDGANFMRPGFLVDAAFDSALAKEEVFGPIAGVFSFSDEDEVIHRANDTKMGLAGYAYTNNQSRIWRLAEKLEVGILGLNHPLPSVVYSPMGGLKGSGLGREGAHDGLLEYLETKYISIGIEEK